MTDIDLVSHFGALDKQGLKDRVRLLQIRARKPKNELEDYELSTNEIIQRKLLGQGASPRSEGPYIDPQERLLLSKSWKSGVLRLKQSSLLRLKLNFINA